MPRIIVQPPYSNIPPLDVCVEKEHFLIGNNEENDLVVNNVSISRFHATIFCYQNEFYIIDHSRNGTYHAACENPSLIPRWSGFQEHKFDDFEEIEQFLKLISDSDKVIAIAAEGIKLQHESKIILPMWEAPPFEMLFVNAKGV